MPKVPRMKGVFVCLSSFDGKGKFGAGEIEKISAHIDLLPTLAEIAESKNCE